MSRTVAPALAPDLADMQGDILHAYGNEYACTTYLFLTLPTPQQGRQWLRGMVDMITTAQRWKGGKPETHVNIALTYPGLVALGLREDFLASFSEEFRLGMAARGELLGDLGSSAPHKWDVAFRDRLAHVLLIVNAVDETRLQQRLSQLSQEIAEAGIHIVHEEHARLLENAREHFGYADGLSQPAIEGSSEESARGGGVAERSDTWRPLALGEFILGYPDEDSRVDPLGRLPRAPTGVLGRAGTYMVWRKLEQNVLAFRDALHEGAQWYADADEEKLAAKIVGRWRNGTPLETNPDAPQPHFDPTTVASNDFRYAADADGRRCPLGAHIRRSNPRDAIGGDGHLSFRHRMIRRGMPYGPPLPTGATADDGEHRGLIFVCYTASISRQFEGVQVQWLEDGNIFHLGHDKDFFSRNHQSGTRKMTIQGAPPFFLAARDDLVETRGGEYLFVPGITALGAVADGVLA